jgi:hypothetical protein
MLAKQLVLVVGPPPGGETPMRWWINSDLRSRHRTEALMSLED